MNNIDFDFGKILNSVLIRSVEEDNPPAAKALKVFDKHDIKVMEAIEILLELQNVLEGEL